MELIPIGLSEGGAWLVPTATLMPRASTKAVSSCCCCWRRVSAMSRGRELKLAVRCSSLDSRLPICFSRSSLRSLSSVIKSYMTFCILERSTRVLAWSLSFLCSILTPRSWWIAWRNFLWCFLTLAWSIFFSSFVCL